MQGKVFPAFKVPQDRIQLLTQVNEPNWTDKASPQLATLVNIMDDEV